MPRKPRHNISFEDALIDFLGEDVRVIRDLATDFKKGCDHLWIPDFELAQKAVDIALEYLEYGVTTHLLIPLRPNTEYWRKKVLPNAARIDLVAERIRFDGYKKGFPNALALVTFDGYRYNRSKDCGGYVIFPMEFPE
jgi:hypothetical protein